MYSPVAPSPTERVGFNGPAVRLHIAKSSDYIPHPVFCDYVKWGPVTYGSSTLLSTTKVEPDGTPSPADLIIVGVVSNDRPNIGPLGNWKDSYNMKLYDVKLQFTLKRPTGFVDFEDNFDNAILRLKELEAVVATKGSKHMWFILDDDVLRFSHRLFQDKPEVPEESSDMEDYELKLVREAQGVADERASVSRQYSIKDKDIQESVNKLLTEYDLVPLEVYDRSHKLVPPTDIARSLKGALVQVTFYLHYTSVPSQKASSFRGQVVQITILKNTTQIGTSPRKRGPIKLHVAEVREDQSEAVRRFLLPKVLLPDGLDTDEDRVNSLVSRE